MKARFEFTISWNESMDVFNITIDLALRKPKVWNDSSYGDKDWGIVAPFFMMRRYTLPF